MRDKIPLGISAWLPEDSVYKRLAFAAEALTPRVQFEPVSPEMATGLPGPATRPEKADAQQCVSDKREGELTGAMGDFARRRIARFENLCGYIVCAGSPDCGKARRRTSGADEETNRGAGRGIYTQLLMESFPWLPVEEDERLNDAPLRENFAARIYALHELHALRDAGLTRGGLIAFHTRYKLLLLAHSQPLYRALGPFVAAIHQWPSLEAFFAAYRLRLMALMSRPATRRNHTNVLMHVQGYFRSRLSGRQRQELAGLIDSYRQGTQPLLAPVALLKHYMAEFPDAYLAGQRYFAPWPETLARATDTDPEK